jgi:hypothetical protein
LEETGAAPDQFVIAGPGGEWQNAPFLPLTGLAAQVQYLVSLRATDHMPACDVCA